MFALADIPTTTARSRLDACLAIGTIPNAIPLAAAGLDRSNVLLSKS